MRRLVLRRRLLWGRRRHRVDGNRLDGGSTVGSSNRAGITDSSRWDAGRSIGRLGDGHRSNTLCRSLIGEGGRGGKRIVLGLFVGDAALEPLGTFVKRIAAALEACKLGGVAGLGLAVGGIGHRVAERRTFGTGVGTELTAGAVGAACGAAEPQAIAREGPGEGLDTGSGKREQEPACGQARPAHEGAADRPRPARHAFGGQPEIERRGLEPSDHAEVVPLDLDDEDIPSHVRHPQEDPDADEEGDEPGDPAGERPDAGGEEGEGGMGSGGACRHHGEGEECRSAQHARDLPCEGTAGGPVPRERSGELEVGPIDPEEEAGERPGQGEGGSGRHECGAQDTKEESRLGGARAGGEERTEEHPPREPQPGPPVGARGRRVGSGVGMEDRDLGGAVREDEVGDRESQSDAGQQVAVLAHGCEPPPEGGEPQRMGEGNEGTGEESAGLPGIPAHALARPGELGPGGHDRGEERARHGGGRSADGREGTRTVGMVGLMEADPPHRRKDAAGVPAPEGFEERLVVQQGRRLDVEELGEAVEGRGKEVAGKGRERPYEGEVRLQAVEGGGQPDGPQGLHEGIQERGGEEGEGAQEAKGARDVAKEDPAQGAIGAERGRKTVGVVGQASGPGTKEEPDRTQEPCRGGLRTEPREGVRHRGHGAGVEPIGKDVGIHGAVAGRIRRIAVPLRQGPRRDRRKAVDVRTQGNGHTLRIGMPRKGSGRGRLRKKA